MEAQQGAVAEPLAHPTERRLPLWKAVPLVQQVVGLRQVRKAVRLEELRERHRHPLPGR